MGVTFRGSGYVRRVRFGKRTVKDGEMLMVWDIRGRLTRIKGPALVRLFMSTIRFCTKYTALPNQYLEVHCANGELKRIPGPASMFEDHLLHKNVFVKDAISVPQGGCIIVYEQGGLKESSIMQKVVNGPCRFVPSNKQQITRAPLWEGDAPNIVPLKSKAQTVLVKDITTSDNEKMTIEILVTFRVKNVLQFCATVTSPAAEVYNAVRTDLIRIFSTKTYDEAILHVSELSSVSSFPALSERAGEIGMVIESASCNSFKVDDAKQAKQAKVYQMEAMQKEKDFNLNKELERSARKMRLADIEHAELIKREKEKRAMELDFIKQLAEYGCNITQYLIAKELASAPEVASAMASEVNPFKNKKSVHHK